MQWDQLSPGRRLELMTSLAQKQSSDPFPLPYCHLLEKVRDARRILTTRPVAEATQPMHEQPDYPIGTRLLVRIHDITTGRWQFQAHVSDYFRNGDQDAMILSALSELVAHERRAHFRQPCHFPIRLLSLDHPIVASAVMLNFGSGGVLIQTDFPTVVGQLFRLEVPIPHGGPLVMSGRVVRQEQVEDAYLTHYHVALQFDRAITWNFPF